MPKISSKLLRYIAAAAILIFFFQYTQVNRIPGNNDKHVEQLEKQRPNLQLENDVAEQQKKISYVKANATFISLARNRDLYNLVNSIRLIEDRFNHQFHYDWVFLNDEDFTPEFIEVTTNFVSGKTHYGKIPKEHWSIPSSIDLNKAKTSWEQMQDQGVLYGGSESYRHMCRYESGFFWRHPILDQFKYYWRIEPDVTFYCDIPYDVFQFMTDNKYAYGFTTSLHEYPATIKTLWNTTREFIGKHPEYLAKNNMLEFVSWDFGENYNYCHFWSNFEIGDMDFWRSEAYRKYFEYLDNSGGFFYERWGDAPVHSIAAALFLNKSQIHHFDDIGYKHMPFVSCPTDPEIHKKRNCGCNPEENFTWKRFSCTSDFYLMQEKPIPAQSWLHRKKVVGEALRTGGKQLSPEREKEVVDQSNKELLDYYRTHKELPPEMKPKLSGLALD
ncbi:uncharacterized protein SAPINGB_P003335 [Magnusiomyces paraingens]|uniref:Glycosyltransferase family 15 protein n=1 Tax=Magnusiomyces paraingens TaxID=2606893 RepID=A0A5E8BNT1_9ASCO|nr:uncharacterized protein SAPINGB_P003335 [Saprochaete ingens]VVT52963.1 unnamed protein product [Saprochaete ingens]